MSAPTTSVIFTSTNPAPPAGNQNVKPQSDGATPLQSISLYPQKATGSLLGVVKPDGTSITVASDGTISSPASFTHAEPLLDGLGALILDGHSDIIMVLGVPN